MRVYNNYIKLTGRRYTDKKLCGGPERQSVWIYHKAVERWWWYFGKFSAGTALSPSGADASTDDGSLLISGPAASGVSCDDSVGATFKFGSTVFMQKLRFEEFCWSYFGRACGFNSSAGSKKSVWPPP